jgi:hypothetical protein
MLGLLRDSHFLAMAVVFAQSLLSNAYCLVAYSLSLINNRPTYRNIFYVRFQNTIHFYKQFQKEHFKAQIILAEQSFIHRMVVA